MCEFIESAKVLQMPNMPIFNITAKNNDEFWRLSDIFCTLLASRDDITGFIIRNVNHIW